MCYCTIHNPKCLRLVTPSTQCSLNVRHADQPCNAGAYLFTALYSQACQPGRRQLRAAFIPGAQACVPCQGGAQCVCIREKVACMLAVLPPYQYIEESVQVQARQEQRRCSCSKALAHPAAAGTVAVHTCGPLVALVACLRTTGRADRASWGGRVVRQQPAKRVAGWKPLVKVTSCVACGMRQLNAMNGQEVGQRKSSQLAGNQASADLDGSGTGPGRCLSWY